MDLAVVITGIWVEALATMVIGADGIGVTGMGLAITLTLYRLLASTILLLLSLALSPEAFLTMGLVLGWVGHSRVCCGWVCCSWAWVEAWVWGKSSLLTPDMFLSFG